MVSPTIRMQSHFLRKRKSKKAQCFSWSLFLIVSDASMQPSGRARLLMKCSLRVYSSRSSSIGLLSYLATVHGWLQSHIPKVHLSHWSRVNWDLKFSWDKGRCWIQMYHYALSSAWLFGFDLGIRLYDFEVYGTLALSQWINPCIHSWKMIVRILKYTKYYVSATIYLLTLSVLLHI